MVTPEVLTVDDAENPDAEASAGVPAVQLFADIFASASSRPSTEDSSVASSDEHFQALEQQFGPGL